MQIFNWVPIYATMERVSKGKADVRRTFRNSFGAQSRANEMLALLFEGRAHQGLRANVDNALRLIDINELSRRLSIPKGTLYNWVYLRRIPFIKAGRSLRFDADEVIQSLPHSGTMSLADQRWKGH